MPLSGTSPVGQGTSDAAVAEIHNDLLNTCEADEEAEVDVEIHANQSAEPPVEAAPDLAADNGLPLPHPELPSSAPDVTALTGKLRLFCWFGNKLSTNSGLTVASYSPGLTLDSATGTPPTSPKPRRSPRTPKKGSFTGVGPSGYGY